MFGFLERMRGMSFNKSSLQNAVGSEILVSDDMLSAQKLWREMYLGSSDGINLPFAISSELARMVTIELSSVVSGSPRADFLNDAYRRVIDGIRIPLELGCAMGGVAFKPYVENGKIGVDFITPEGFFPTAINTSGQITGAVFVQRIRENKSFLTRLESHSLSGGVYKITNRAFSSPSKDMLGRPVELSETSAWSGVAKELCIGNIKAPLFGYFKPASANTVDPSSPLGVSVFSGAVGLIADAEKQYNRYLWEFESGERALIANSMAFRVGKDGRPQLPNKRLYRTLDVEDIDFFKEWSPQLRETELADGLDRIYRQIEFCCGLAYGTLSNVNNTDKTAEEIRTSKQRSYTTVTDNQKSLKGALSGLVYAMDVLATLYNLAPLGKYNISFDFDDSIVADRKMEFDEKKQLLDAGVMLPWEFRAWYFGESREEALASLSGNEGEFKTA